MQPVQLFLNRDQAKPGPAARAAREQWPVALVSMPFVVATRPSLQLGLLQAIAAEQGFPVTALHLNLDFARQIGAELYDALCQHRGRLIGDWLFAAQAFGGRAPDSDGKFLEAFGPEMTGWLAQLSQPADRLRTLREVDIPRYLDD